MSAFGCHHVTDAYAECAAQFGPRTCGSLRSSVGTGSKRLVKCTRCSVVAAAGSCLPRTASQHSTQTCWARRSGCVRRDGRSGRGRSQRLPSPLVSQAVAAKELPRRRPAAPPVARPASSAAAPAPRAAPKKPLATDAAGVVLLLDDSADDDDDDGVEDGEGCDDSSVEGVDMVAAVLGSAAPAPATAGGAAAAASSGGTSSGAPGRKRPRSWAWERSPIPVPLPSSAAESAAAGRPPAAWDVVVLDEAHKIKK